MRALKWIIPFPVMVLSLVVFSGQLFAQPVDPLQQPCSNPNAQSSPACKENKEVQGNDASVNSDDVNPIFGPKGVITKLINTLSIVVGIAAVIAIIAAGLRFTLSGSNPQEVNVAREMIIYAAVAIILAASSQFIVRFWLYKIG